ncbi:Major Facilitator Superfamily [Geosmithia morbida]|uniref:Major Facilitator Superfamily n=1 Tax=Geosmithia morbida TaxID=1094350 RepID=A0A9P4YPY5_9HYPO|nr:Major Facilitator Superfamily [Geosmithia morbida]KAF4119662.1 Major Facilitator Superfamily [Geosmithia morbida]
MTAEAFKDTGKERVDDVPSDSGPIQAGDEPVPVDPELVRRVFPDGSIRGLTLSLPGYGLVVYDKAILGSAALFGMVDDLDLRVGDSTSRLSWATSLFYLGQLAGSYPTTYLVQHFRTRWTVGPAVMIWAIVAASAAGCKTYQGLFAQRFFLGFSEAIIPTSFMSIISGFYTQEEQAARQTLWFSGAGWFTAIGPILNYGFAQIDGGALHSWQYCFVFAGILTSLFGLWAFFMPDSPTDAWFLTGEERVTAVERLRAGQTGIRNHEIKLDQIKESILDPTVWLVFVMMASGYTANGAVTGFGPLIVSTFGYSTLSSALFQMPIGFLCVLSSLLTGLAASRWRNIRFPLLLACCAPVIAGYIIIWKSSWGDRPAAPVAGYSIIGFFGGVVGLVVPIASSNVAGDTKRSFTAAAVFAGYCVGNIVGPQMVVSSEKERHYPTLWSGLIGCYMITIVATSTLWFLLWRENKRRAGLNLDKAEAGRLGFHDLTDRQNLHFVYKL